MEFRVLDAMGAVIQRAATFHDLNLDVLEAIPRWEIWADEQCLARVDLTGFFPAAVAEAREAVQFAINGALETSPDLSYYRGCVIVRMGECFRPLPEFVYTAYMTPHGPDYTCKMCGARGWDAENRCACRTP